MSAVTETRLVLKVAKISDNKIQKSFQSLRNINSEKRNTTQAHDFIVPLIFPTVHKFYFWKTNKFCNSIL